MKPLKILLVGAVALMAFAGCEKEKEAEHDDYYYAQNATISSSSSAFSNTDGEQKIQFKVSGGEVKINVNCGTEWNVFGNNSNFFTTTVTSTSVTVTAGQNLVEEELTGKFSLATVWYGIPFATITVTQDAYGSPEIAVDTNEWHAPAIGDGMTTTIGVEATGEWSVENNADWLTVEKTETGLNLAVVGNNETPERVAEVVLTCADGFNSDSETIKVTQDGLAYITLDEEDLLLSSFGSTKSVAVESNFDWDYSYDTSNGWFTIDKGEKESALSITYEANETGADREGVVTLTAGDGATNVAEAELKITQSWENFDALILEYTVTSNKTKIKIPIQYVSSTITIDWDDGTTSIPDGRFPSHTYSTPGIYDVTINGTLGHLTTEDIGYSSFHAIDCIECLTAVKQWGNTGLTSLRYAFRECTNLKTLPEETGDGLANVTTLYYAFYDCTSLESVPSDFFEKCSSAESFERTFNKCSALKTATGKMPSTATTFYYTFSDCTSLVSAPSFEGCSKVTTFTGTFYKCSTLTTIPENMFSGCTAVTSFYNCFYNCSSLASAPSFEECSSVGFFGYTFYGCSSLASAPSFKGLSAVTSFESTFYGCSSLTTIPKNMFSGCSAVTSFASSFRGCSSLVSAPSFEGLSAVTSFESTFYGCSSLTTIPENMFSDCTAVTTFRGTFRDCSFLVSAPSFEGCASVTTFNTTFDGCTALTTIPEKMFSMCSAVTIFSYTFDGCSSLTTVPISLFDDALLVTAFNYTFYGCSSVSGESPYTEIEVDGEKVKVHLYERSDYAVTMRCSIPTSYGSCFTGSTFSDIDSIPSGWGGNGN